MSSVVVGWIDPGTVQGQFAASLAKMVMYSTATKILAGVQRWQSGPHVERGRNGLVKDFLASDAEYLLQIDSDMVFNHDALEKLLGTAERMDTPVVGGLCFSYTAASGPFPTVGMFQDDGRVAWLSGIAGTDRAGCVTCDVTGCAMLLVHRDVFDTVGADPFDRIVDDTGVLLGEDISFCRRLKDAGIPVVVDTNVETGHVKSFTWDRESHAKYRIDNG